MIIVHIIVYRETENYRERGYKTWAQGHARTIGATMYINVYIAMEKDWQAGRHACTKEEKEAKL